MIRCGGNVEKPAGNIIMDVMYTVPDSFPPQWARGFGEDDHGVFAQLAVDGITFDFRWIPAGRFSMGALEREEGAQDTERPQHKVALTQGYWLLRTPVTQVQWEVVTGANPSHFTGTEQPVEQVSWEDCVAYTEKLNQLVPELKASLPTEAQWEYACRAGTTSVFHYGDHLDSTMANFDGNYPYGGASIREYREKTTPVASFAPNEWGLYDMHGNVDEWCYDGMRTYDSAAVSDPVGPTDKDAGRVVRGGSWNYYAGSCRSAFRDDFRPVYRFSNLGFRLAAGQKNEGE